MVHQQDWWVQRSNAKAYTTMAVRIWPVPTMIWHAKVLKTVNNFQGSTDSTEKTIWKNVHKIIKEYFEPFPVKTKIVGWRTLWNSSKAILADIIKKPHKQQNLIKTTHFIFSSYPYQCDQLLLQCSTSCLIRLQWTMSILQGKKEPPHT